MNGTKSDIEHWVNKVSNKIDYKSHLKCIIYPPSCYLDSTRQFISKIDSPIKLGSQEIDSTNSGALTGGINAQMLKDFSTEYVLIGHSEQRDHLNEDNITLRSKLDTAIQSGISAIFCIGEPAEVKLSGNTENFLSEQLDVLTSEAPYLVIKAKDYKTLTQRASGSGGIQSHEYRLLLPTSIFRVGPSR